MISGGQDVSLIWTSLLKVQSSDIEWQKRQVPQTLYYRIESDFSKVLNKILCIYAAPKHHLNKFEKTRLCGQAEKNTYQKI